MQEGRERERERENIGESPVDREIEICMASATSRRASNLDYIPCSDTLYGGAGETLLTTVLTVCDAAPLAARIVGPSPYLGVLESNDN